MIFWIIIGRNANLNFRELQKNQPTLEEDAVESFAANYSSGKMK